MALYLGFQGPGDSIEEHYQLLKSRVDTSNAHCSVTGNHAAQTGRTLARIRKEKEISKSKYKVFGANRKAEFDKEVSRITREAYHACLFIAQVNNNGFGYLKQLLVNDGLKGDATYLTALEDTTQILNGYQAIINKKSNNNNAATTIESRLAFVQLVANGKQT